MSSEDPPTIQSIVGSWWEEAKPPRLEHGRLVWTFVPYPDIESLRLVKEGRQDPREHRTAMYRVEPMRSGSTQAPTKLPVAALPTFKGESHWLHRGKRRPAVVLSMGDAEIEKKVVQGSPGRLRRSCVLVLPYYGGDLDPKRAGIPNEFAERMRRAEYPRFLLDNLPIGGPEKSYLRFDHVTAVGSDPKNFDLTDHRLSEGAMEVIREWFQWFVEGVLPDPEESSLALVIELLRENEAIV